MGRYSRYMVGAVVLFLLVSAMPVLDTSANEGTGPRQGPILPMTLYLQNTTDAHYVFDYSTTQIFNTNVGNRSNFLGDQHRVRMSWYLHPLLAGDLHVQGDVTVWVYMNTTGVSANGNLQFTLKELSYKLDATTETVAWQQVSGNQGVVVETGINSYSVTMANVDHVFQAGNSIGLEWEIGGGASAYFGLWFGNATHDARIEFSSSDHLAIEDVYTLDYQDTPTVNYEFDLPDKTVKIRANLSDPFGGYDIYDVRCTLKDPNGAVVIDNETMALINGTPNSHYSIFETLWDFASAEPGRYDVRIWAVDNNGFNFYDHREQYNYDGYWVEELTSFWVGGLPANFHVNVTDSRGDPLVGATVTASRGGKIIENVTDASGTVGLGLYPSLYTIKVFWEDVEVASEDVDVVDGMWFDIMASVYYPVIEVLDANGDPLAGASVTEVHPNGTVFLAPWITNSTGRFAIDMAPGGTYRFVVKWQDVEVANEFVNIDSNGVFTINAGVFTLTITAQDSHGEPLPGAQVVIVDDLTRLVFDSKLTNLQGGMTTQLPIGTYDIDVYWAESGVGGEADYFLDANADLVIQCDVYYATIKTVDSMGMPVSDAQVMVLSSLTGSLLGSGRTNDLGMTTMRLPMGLHDYQVHWRDIMVATGSGPDVSGDIPTTDPFVIVVQVHYAAIKVVDSRDLPLPGALVTVTSQGGGVFDFLQTSGNGTCVVRVPQGTHIVLVQWKGMDVARETNFTVTGDIPISDPFILKASVYYLTVKVLDSRDKGLANAVVNIYHQNGETADTGLTGNDGTVVIRLPMAVYDLNVYWKEIEVGGLADHNFTADGTLTLEVGVYYVTFKALDSRQLSVNKAFITVYYWTGVVMDSAQTDDAGEIFLKLPGTSVDVQVAWKGELVGGLTNHTIDADGVVFINLEVYYLTVKVKGADGTGVGGAEVSLTYKEGTFDAGRTRESGKAEFRVAKGDYNVTVRFTTTYMLSSVFEKQEKQVTVAGDETMSFELENYPPPIYTTVAFAVTLFVIILIIILMLVFTTLSKKLKRAAMTGREPERLRPGVAEPVEDGDSVGDAKPAVPVDDDEPKGPDTDPGPEEKDLDGKQQEVETPAEDTEPLEGAPRTDADQDIDRTLEDLEKGL